MSRTVATALAIVATAMALVVIGPVHVDATNNFAGNFKATWCHWGPSNPMTRPTFAWNASSAPGAGELQYLAVVRNGDAMMGGMPGFNLSDKPVRWKHWLNFMEFDLRRRENSICDFMFDGQSPGGWYDEGLLEDMTDVVNSDIRFRWDEMSFATRRYVAEYKGRVVAIPIANQFPLLLYRRDLISVAPKTWEEALALGAKWHGKDLNNDNTTDFGFCFDGHGVIGQVGLGIVASIMKFETGDRQGYMYDLADNDDDPMTALFNTKGYEYALDIVARMYALSSQEWSKNRGLTSFPQWAGGRCALWMTWGNNAGKAVNNYKKQNNYAWGRQGAAPLPGSKLIYHRQNRTLVECTLALCPFVVSGAINRPALQAGGGRFVVRKRVAQERAGNGTLAAIVNALTVAVNSIDVRSSGTPPTREDQYNVTWFMEKNWDFGDASAYLSALQRAGTSLHTVAFVPISTFVPTWGLIQEAMKQAARADQYKHLTKNVSQIVAELDANITLMVAKNNYTMKEIENGMRHALSMLPLREPVYLEVDNTPYWVIPVVLLIVILAALFGGYKYNHWAATAACPKDPNVPFTAFFVGLKNEVKLTDVFPDTIGAALSTAHDITKAACKKHKCYDARRIGNVHMVVAKSREDALACACQIQKEFQATDWGVWFNESTGNLFTLKRQPKNKSEGSRRSSKKTSTSGDDARSQRSTRSRRSVGSQCSVTSSYGAHGEVELALQPNIGLWYGLGSIVHEEERNSYSYAGPVVDCAAELSDVANAEQILSTKDFFDLCDEDDVNLKHIGHPGDYGERKLRSKKNQKYELQQFTPKGQRSIPYVEKKSSKKGEKEEEEQVVGSISSALELSAGGLTTRRCAVGVIYVPELRNTGSAYGPDLHAEKVTNVVKGVEAIAVEYKGDLISVLDGRIVVACNAITACSSAPARMCNILLESIAKIKELGFTSPSTGVSLGAAVVGIMEGEDGRTMKTISGSVFERARVFQTVAAAQGLDAVTTAGFAKDVNTSFYSQTFDFITWPEEPHKLTTLVGIMSKRDAAAAEDEWMYELENSDATNPYRTVNALFTQVEQACSKPAPSPDAAENSGNESLLAEFADFLAMVDGEKTPPEDQRQAVTSPGAKNLKEIVSLTNQDALKAYAAGRTKTMQLHV